MSLITVPAGPAWATAEAGFTNYKSRLWTALGRASALTWQPWAAAHCHSGAALSDATSGGIHLEIFTTTPAATDAMALSTRRGPASGRTLG